MATKKLCATRAFSQNVFVSADFAVGAPYEMNGAGRVYIYHGSAIGINTRPAQVGAIPLSPVLQLSGGSSSCVKFQNS